VPHTYSRQLDLKWIGHELRLTSGRLLATVKPDPEWPNLWRVHMPDGHVTDMVNLSRAKDAASTLALAVLNRPEMERRNNIARGGQERGEELGATLLQARPVESAMRPAGASLARSNGTTATLH
jgi:hypothetical protein